MLVLLWFKLFSTAKGGMGILIRSDKSNQSSRVSRRSFTYSSSQIRTWQSPVVQLFSANLTCQSGLPNMISITLSSNNGDSLALNSNAIAPF